jgi:hypothetical protein
MKHALTGIAYFAIGLLLLFQQDADGELLINGWKSLAAICLLSFAAGIWQIVAGMYQTEEPEVEDTALDTLKALYFAAAPVANIRYSPSLHNALGNAEMLLLMHDPHFEDELHNVCSIPKTPAEFRSVRHPTNRELSRSRQFDALFEHTGSFESLKDRHGPA